MNEDDRIMIREGAPDDAEALLDFLNIVGAETDNMTFGAEGFPFTVEQEREYLIRMHDDENSVTLIAVRNGEIIGDASIKGLGRRMAHRADLGISVRKDYWGMGIGSKLLEKITEYARAHGIEIIGLEVRCDNIRAIRLYEKYGFRKIGTYPAFFKINHKDGTYEYVDFDIMYLDLR